MTHSLSRREYLNPVKIDTGLGANHTVVEVDSGSATRGWPRMVPRLSTPGDREPQERVSEDAIEVGEIERIGSRPGSIK